MIWRRSLVVAVLILFALFCVIPFYIMIMMGTYSTNDLFLKLPLWFGHALVENARQIATGHFLRIYWNSLYVALLSTALCLTFCTFAGFAFAKYRFKGKNALFLFVLSTMMIPNQLGLIGFVIEMKRLHLNDTHIPLVAASTISAFGVFFMTLFIRSSVPNEIMESGRIDGCNEPVILLRIVLPYLLPALSTLGMMVFLGSWNNFLIPLVTINKLALYTLPIGIAEFGSIFRVEYATQILALTVGTLPLIVVFLIGSKTFVKGMTMGAVKS